MKKSRKNTTRCAFVGLRRHTHVERSEILTEFIVPTLRKELGRNLIAIAADGSFARREDGPYSDLELMIFVEDKKDLPFGFSRVHDGLLIEGLFVTEQEFHRMIHEPNEQWYIAGSDRLFAVTNPAFVKRLKKYHVRDRAQKFRRMVRGATHEVQEAFGKLFNAIDRRNRENLFIVLSETVTAVLKFVSYINQKPYTSSGKFITEARTMKIKPDGLNGFLRVVVANKYPDWDLLQEAAEILFKGIETFLKKRYGRELYDSDLSRIINKNRNNKRR
ncbi:MAG: hypothetical protein JSW49_07195 [candidate division WOR-3 bacterium]|nr:MAG: hypothetical protein JSW49_07195 [candidate division WOR-3 bacterium]